MSIEGILVGVLAIAVGLAWAFYGLRAFIVLLPIWAFLIGLIAGASWGQEFLGEGFFGTVTSWAIGIALGIVLAALSYFWYMGAVILFGATIGYTLGVGIMAAIGATGFLGVVVGIIVGALFAVAFIVLNMPVALVIWLTAAGGAAAVVNGALILLGRIQLPDIDQGLMEGLIKEGIIGWVAWLVIAVVGVMYQTRDVGRAVTAGGGPAVDRSAYRVS